LNLIPSKNSDGASDCIDLYNISTANYFSIISYIFKYLILYFFSNFIIYIKMFNLTINSTNVANSLNNMYQYQFKNGAFEVPAGAEMMITSFQIPYSWYNITNRYNNNSFKIYWPISTVNSLTVTNGGSGYTDVPTVVFTGTNTTVATATAV